MGRRGTAPWRGPSVSSEHSGSTTPDPAPLGHFLWRVGEGVQVQTGQGGRVSGQPPFSEGSRALGPEWSQGHGSPILCCCLRGPAVPPTSVTLGSTPGPTVSSQSSVQEGTERTPEKRRERPQEIYKVH